MDNRVGGAWSSKYTRFANSSTCIIGERSEPLSRVYNDQPSGIYIWWNPYVRMFLIRMLFR